LGTGREASYGFARGVFGNDWATATGVLIASEYKKPRKHKAFLISGVEI
jgi:hypothetical protein